MTDGSTTRRAALGFALAGLVLAGGSTALRAQTPQLAALAPAAEAEGKVTWYESSPTEAIDRVLAAFNKRYPKIKVTHGRRIGGSGMSTRIIQEVQSNAPTADAGTVGPDEIEDLRARGLLMDVDWAALGLPPSLAPVPFALASNISIWVIAYNETMVSPADAPKTWDDLLLPRWKGNKIATLPGGFPFAQLAKGWGVDKARAYTEKFAAQAPLLYASGFTLAQGVGAGEFPVTVGVYHTTVPTLQKGAPIKIVIPEPVPINTQYSFILKASKNPNATKLFLAWLNTDEGALAYEAATGRGNGLLATKTAELIKGKPTVEWPIAEIDQYYKLLTDSAELLKKGGTASK